MASCQTSHAHHAAAGIANPDFGETVFQNLSAGVNQLAQVNTPMNMARMAFDPTARCSTSRRS